MIARKTTMLPILAMLTLLVGACSNNSSGTSKPSDIPKVGEDWHPQSADQLRERYAAALHVDDSHARTIALKGIAVDAANADIPEYAVQAVTTITEPAEKDDAARYCAERFDDLGRRPLALQFISMVSDPAIKDKLQQRLANKSGANRPNDQP